MRLALYITRFSNIGSNQASRCKVTYRANRYKITYLLGAVNLPHYDLSVLTIDNIDSKFGLYITSHLSYAQYFLDFTNKYESICAHLHSFTYT